jgi:zinc and cadmium transporter
MNWWSGAILASIITSLVSLSGIILLLIGSKDKIHKLTIGLVSIAAGTLLGDAFIHLIPEAVEQTNWSIYVIGGILIFFVLEKILKWRHCHEEDCQENKKLVGINFGADTVHNIIDGIAIGTSFSLSQEVGLATTLAIILHEVPQEISDFGIMIHAGVKVKKALWLNFLSALGSVAGVLLVLIFNIDKISEILAAITAGGFIYLAASDLIPEMHRHDTKISDSITQLVLVIIGVMIMWWFGSLE